MTEIETETDERWARLPELIGRPHYAYDRWTIEMLVRFAGHKKAGARIIERIEQQLAEHNIGHLPAKLPTDSTRQVLLYRKDDPGFGLLLDMVHQLATADVNDSMDPTVYGLQGTLDIMAKLQQVPVRKTAS